MVHLNIVKIIWDDAQASGGWKTPKEIDHEPDRIESVGWLVREDEVGVTICQSYNSSDRISDTLFVPASYIVGKVVVLVVDEKQKSESVGDRSG